MIIDVMNEVLTNLKTNINDVVVLSSYPPITPSFPCMIIEELSNNTDLFTIDSSGEHHSIISIEINIFSNVQNKITQVRDIRGRVDAIMSGTYRMTRDFSGAVPNYADTDIYRYTLRYSFTIDSTKQIYRR